MTPIQILYLTLFLFALGYTIVHYLGPACDPREPPVIQEKISYFSHLLSLLYHGHEYLERLSKKHNNLPIYTLQTLTKRIYVICSHDLVVAVQKDNKSISLNPFIATFIPRMFDLGKKDRDIVVLNHDSEKGDWGFVPEMHHKAFSTLAPGLDMDWMVRTALDTTTSFFNKLDKEVSGNGLEIDLWAWTREFSSLASTEAVYGPENPFKHVPGLVDAFWDYEAGLEKLLLDIFPKYVAPKAYSGRHKVSSAMCSYFSRNGHDQASALLKARYEVGKKNDMSVEGISSLELANCIAVLINATPMVFWMIWHIYSAPNLLQDLRDEVTSILRETVDENGTHLKLNVGIVKSHCPQLFSTYQEILRVRTHNASHRWVTEDTLLSNRYLLKKNNPVQLPGQAIHSKAALWGPDVNNFNPRRFIKSKTHNVKTSSLRAFGGGKTLCPGRHLATTEIMSVVALMIVRFDVTPLGTQGWVDPQCASGKLLRMIPPPVSDIKVVVSARDSCRDVHWEFDGVGEERTDTARFDVA